MFVLRKLDLDMRDKLTTFIIKNPPETKKGSKDKKAMRRAEKERLKEGEVADEEQKKLKKEVKKKCSSTSKDGTTKPKSIKKKASDSDEDHTSPTHSQVDEKEEAAELEDDVEVQWQTDTSLEAARQRIQEQLSAVTANMVMLSTNEHEKNEKAVSKVSDGSENGNSMHYRTLIEQVKAKLKKGVAANELQSHLATIPASAQEKISALFEALFEGIEKGFAKEVIKKKSYLAAAVSMEEGSQLPLLHAVEAFCLKPTSNALKEVAFILKALYNADLLEEEHILQWHQEGQKGDSKDYKIWKNAEPFIDWLQNAESESEGE